MPDIIAHLDFWNLFTSAVNAVLAAILLVISGHLIADYIERDWHDTLVWQTRTSNLDLWAAATIAAIASYLAHPLFFESNSFWEFERAVNAVTGFLLACIIWLLLRWKYER